MSPLDEEPGPRRPTTDVLRPDRRLNWAPLVVLLAVACTVAWTFMWLWMAVSAVRAAFS
jgi:hypothetical protein